jgi:hypothetical protein
VRQDIYIAIAGRTAALGYDAFFKPRAAKIDRTTGARIYEARGGRMLLFTRAIPWILKACTVCVVMLRALSKGGATGRPERVLVAVAFVTFASVLPSLLCCVADRAKTTAYILQSALFLGCTHAALFALDGLGVPQYQVAVTQTCVLHMLWSQWQVLDRHKQILIYQPAVKVVLVLVALLSWGASVLMLPHVPVDMLALVGLMFVGEVLGVIVCFVAAMLVAVGDTVEAFLTDKS